MIAEFSPMVWVVVGWMVAGFAVVAVESGLLLLSDSPPVDEASTPVMLRAFGGGLIALAGLYVMGGMMFRLALAEIRALEQGELAWPRSSRMRPAPRPLEKHV